MMPLEVHLKLRQIMSDVIGGHRRADASEMKFLSDCFRKYREEYRKLHRELKACAIARMKGV